MRTAQLNVETPRAARGASAAVAVVAALCLLATAGTLIPVARAQDAKDTPESAAGKLFEESCAQCHTVPDARLRTDRAWLDQVHRTA